MQHSSESKADWENLLPELLAAIAKRLTSTLDYNSFRGVCESWRSASTFENFDHAFPRAPWIIFTKDHGTKFFDPSKNKIFMTAKLAEEAIYYYLSSSGWLLGNPKSSVRICLTHPIRCISIKLPDLDTFPRYTYYLTKQRFYNNYSQFIIKKMVLSGSPTIVPDLVIMVIWGAKRQLAFSRPGDSCWTLMEFWHGSFSDILYHNEKLYAIDDKHRVVECDIHGPNPTQMQQILSLPGFDYFFDIWRCYMAESSGKFLIVSVSCYREFILRVFEFDLMDGSHKEINDMGNKTMFVSDRSSSLCLEGFDWNDEVKRNCIYDAYSGEYFDMRGRRYYGRFSCPNFSSEVDFPTWVVPGF